MDHAPLDTGLITRIVEAALLAASQPLTLQQLHGLFPLDEPAPDGSIEQALDTLPRQDRDTAPAAAFVPDRAEIRLPPPVELREMLLALHEVFKRAELYTQHAIKRDALSVRQRMGELLERLHDGAFHRFESLFTAEEGKLGVVVTFLGLLTLAKEQLVEIVQDAPLAPIYVKSLAVGEDTAQIELSSEFDEAANDDGA